MQDNKDKETSADNVQSTREYKKEFRQEHGCLCCVLQSTKKDTSQDKKRVRKTYIQST
jgi:G3E family GTPase